MDDNGDTKRVELPVNSVAKLLELEFDVLYSGRTIRSCGSRTWKPERAEVMATPALLAVPITDNAEKRQCLSLSFALSTVVTHFRFSEKNRSALIGNFFVHIKKMSQWGARGVVFIPAFGFNPKKVHGPCGSGRAVQAHAYIDRKDSSKESIFLALWGLRANSSRGRPPEP